MIPVGGMVLGIELAVNDSDPGNTPSSDYFDWAGIAPKSYAQPYLWKPVRLIGTPSDVTPPSVSITSPLSGTTAAGSVTLMAAASDNVGVAGVQFRLDGAPLGTEVTAAPYTLAWKTTAVPDGAYILTAIARDTAGNTAMSAAVTVSVDNASTLPVVTAVTASGITSTQATITWTTNEASDTHLEYGLTTAYGTTTPLDSRPVTAHAQTLGGLAPTTLYHYRVRSRNAEGRVAVSADFTLTTLSVDAMVYRAAAPITVDGVLNEWSGAPAAQFSGRSNSATAYLQWDDTNLYVAFQVTDPRLNATRTARDAGDIYLDDSVEVYVGTAYDRASTMQPDDYQFLVNLNNAQGDLRGTGAGKDAGWNAIWQSAVRLQGTLNANADTDGGYTVEIAIPWAQIGVIPVSGMVLGIELAVNDSDPASTPSSDHFDWAGIAPNSYAQPTLWKRVQLE